MSSSPSLLVGFSIQDEAMDVDRVRSTGDSIPWGLRHPGSSLHYLGSRPTFFIPRWTTHSCILYQVCDAHGPIINAVILLIMRINRFITAHRPLFVITINSFFISFKKANQTNHHDFILLTSIESPPPAAQTSHPATDFFCRNQRDRLAHGPLRGGVLCPQRR